MLNVTLTGPGVEGLFVVLSIGQPLLFSWSATPDPGVTGPIQVRASLPGGSGAPIWDSGELSTADAAAGGPGRVDTSTLPPAFYQAGYKLISFDAFGTNEGNGSMTPIGSVLAIVRVMPAVLGPTALVWTQPTSTTIDWKQSYQPTVILTDVLANGPSLVSLPVTPAAKLSGNCMLTEQQFDRFGDVFPVNQLANNSPSLITDESTSLASPLITQAWEWIIPGVYLVEWDALQRQYRYTIGVQLTDDSDNVYHGTSHIDVTISVPFPKMLAGQTAQDAAAAAAAALLLALVAPWPANAVFYAIASGAYTTASISYALAVDPPAPDPLFRQAVTISVPDVAQGFAAEAAFEPHAETLRLIATVGTLAVGLSQIEGRVLGAREAGDAASETAQLAHFAQVADALVQAAKDAPGLAKQFVPTPAERADEDRIAATYQRVRRYGLPRKTRDEWKREGLPGATLDALVQVIERPELSATLATLPVAFAQLASSAAQMAQATIADAKQRLAALQGPPPRA